MPLTDEVIRKHLAGEITVGIYPLLSDETCWFQAVDFDKKTWQLDAAAFLATCHEMGVPAALERSRSGLLIPMKAVSDSDLIPVTRSDAMPVMIGAQRRGLLLLTALFAHRFPPASRGGGRYAPSGPECYRPKSDLELASNLSVSRVLISGGAPRAQRKSPPKNLCLRAAHVSIDESAQIHVLRAIRAAMRD